MHLYPNDIYEKLEFDKILERLASYCLGEAAKTKVLTLKSFNKKEKLDSLLDEVLEFNTCANLGGIFPYWAL